MQLIAEAYDILKRGLDLHESEIADIFLKWNTGVLDSFLIESTSCSGVWNRVLGGR